jgi:hypothetical protein
MRGDSESGEVGFRPGVVPAGGERVTEPVPGRPRPTRPLPELGVRRRGGWRRYGLLIAGVAAAVVVAFSAGLLLGTGGGIGAGGRPSPSPSPTPPRDTPQQVVRKYLDAETAGDKDRARGYLCPAVRSHDPLDAAGGASAAGTIRWEVGGQHVTGDTATVDVDLTVPIVGAIPLTAHLVEVDGPWQVCGLLPRTA